MSGGHSIVTQRPPDSFGATEIRSDILPLIVLNQFLPLGNLTTLSPCFSLVAIVLQQRIR